jgi:hypothetical protein
MPTGTERALVVLLCVNASIYTVHSQIYIFLFSALESELVAFRSVLYLLRAK